MEKCKKSWKYQSTNIFNQFHVKKNKINKSESLIWPPLLSLAGLLPVVATLSFLTNTASYSRAGQTSSPKLGSVEERQSPTTTMRSLKLFCDFTTENLCVCVRRVRGCHCPAFFFSRVFPNTFFVLVWLRLPLTPPQKTWHCLCRGWQLLTFWGQCKSNHLHVGLLCVLSLGLPSIRGYTRGVGKLSQPCR